ncbi:hypothetical protein P154DRAFT_532092 [Amniculicola lignicola CBS 123094]|uniref:Uncharacterized protein n=1 Tax=Amniculicola lignicola CBS 123094 TaxID=1392246 RepID=A0A6A5WSF3_9PLEO|nr:hypothetical protein P154DRAFT_532092 [Amniculicola lignicola CBS 123094]
MYEKKIRPTPTKYHPNHKPRQQSPNPSFTTHAQYPNNPQPSPLASPPSPGPSHSLSSHYPKLANLKSTTTKDHTCLNIQSHTRLYLRSTLVTPPSPGKPLTAATSHASTSPSPNPVMGVAVSLLGLESRRSGLWILAVVIYEAKAVWQIRPKEGIIGICLIAYFGPGVTEARHGESSADGGCGVGELLTGEECNGNGDGETEAVEFEGEKGSEEDGEEN